MANLADTEMLYRAFREVDPSGKVSASGISFPDTSVDRACLRAPHDTIANKTPPIGVFSFYVSDIPDQYIDQNDTYSFVAAEDPTPLNPAHALIKFYKNGSYLKTEEPPKRIKRRFRADLYEKITIVLHPLDSLPNP